MISVILTVLKSVPAAAAIFEQVMELYVAWKLEQNRKDENTKNDRNSRAIAGAGELSKYCAACPYRGAGQHGTLTPASPVQ